MKISFILITINVYSLASFSQAVDNYAKNSAKRAELQSLYEKELEENPESAIPHWNHANRLSKVNFMAHKNAPKYFFKALKIDSTNANIYIDFGNYLLGQNLEDAYHIFYRGLQFDPSNRRLKLGIEKVESLVREQEEYWEFKRLPAYNRSKVIESSLPYKQLTAYKKMDRETQKGIFSYKNLSKIFDSIPNLLTPKEMFYLVYGQCKQSYYNPYNYNDEKKLISLNLEKKYMTAISFAEELISIEPVNILVLHELLYSYRRIGDEANVKNTEVRLTKIFEGILFSGDGTCQKPYLAMSIKEENVFCNFLGYRKISVESQIQCSNQITDKVYVENSSGERKYIYFNYTPIYNWILKVSSK